MTQQELELPKGWVETNLTDICSIVYGKGLPIKRMTETGFTVFGANGVIGKYSTYNYETTQTLISCRGANSGEMNMSPPKSFITNNSLILQIPDIFLELKKVIFYQLKIIDRQKIVTGTAQPQVTIENLQDLKIKLSPLNEQKRIASKIEELFSKIDSTKKSLEYTKLQLEFYVDSLLKYAFDRKFSEKYENNSSFFWNDVSVESVLEKRGMFDGPFGSNLKTEHYTNSGVRVARLENIKKLEFDNSKQSFISVARYNALKRHTVFENDILFASFIDSEVRCCIVPRLNDVVINKADCFCIRPDKKQILPKFLMFQLSSRRFFSQIKQKSHGVTRSRINTKQLRSSMIKLCSMEEQEQIVSQLEQGFSLVENSQRIVNSTLQTLETMRMSVLKQAFQGKLVPQDPNDEPASVLLERIKKDKK